MKSGRFTGPRFGTHDMTDTEAIAYGRKLMRRSERWAWVRDRVIDVCTVLVLGGILYEVGWAVASWIAGLLL